MITTNVFPLIINKVSKNFGDKVILENVSLEIKKGESFGLIGLNGIGKTTLIKIILNLLLPDEGKITIFGVSNCDKQSRKNIAFLPEKFMPSFYLKGHEFLELILSYHNKKYEANRAKELAKQLSFDVSYLDKKISSYSKGMAQKLGLIATFMANVPLLILDEPMSGLDPKARIELKRLLKEYRQKGNTLFFSSHIISDIDEICDNIAILHDGKIRYYGTPGHCKERYKNENLEETFLEVIKNY